MKIVVVGGTGQLGREVVAAASEAGLNVVPLGHTEIEVTNPDSVADTVRRLSPDAVVNCAAYVRVDDCEDRPEDAFRVNAIGALHVARAAAAAGALCVYISTDYVFDGEKPEPYSEGDAPRPINVYGVSKLAGEYLTRQDCPRSLIVRLASLFGKGGARGKAGNFVDTILQKAAAGEPVRVVNDIRISPTFSRDAARALLHLLRRGATGIVHLTNRGVTTWYELAQHVLQLAGSRVAIEPVPSDAFPTRARRPKNSALCTRRSGGFTSELRPWEDALREYLREEQP